MATFTSILEAIGQAQSYSDKTQLLSVLLNALQGKKGKPVGEDRTELSTFAFSEIEGLLRTLPTLSTYREKDQLFGYEDQLLGLVMLCYDSPALIAQDELAKIQLLQAMVSKERFVENAIDEIFEGGNTQKETVERLLCMLIPLKDEFQKGQLYQGLLHYQQNIKRLPDDAKALLTDYFVAEMTRYLETPVGEDTLNNLELACDVCRYFLNADLLALLQKATNLQKASVRFYALSTLLEAGEQASPEIIEALANNAEYAALTYAVLKDHGLTTLFPAHLATPEYLAKSDMIRWLLYPTELGQMPDEIEYLGKVKKKEVYHIFRFRSNSDTLDDESKGKWLIGWSSDEGGTFSNFDLYEAFEQKTLEKTLKNIRKKLL